MKKISPIKWRPQDTKKLLTYVRKFNAALTRLAKKNPEIAESGIFPERLNYSDLRDSITTRKSFNQTLAKIDRFFKPGARDIVKDTTGFYTTKWNIREQKLTEKRINAQRKKYIEEFKVPKAQQQFLNLNPISFEEKKKRIAQRLEGKDAEEAANIMQDFYNFVYTAERESQDQYLNARFAKLRNAYFHAIDIHLKEDDAIKLKNFLNANNVWGSDIVYAISINDILDFEYYYSLDTAEEKYQTLLEYWTEIMPEILEMRERNGLHG